MKKASNYAYVAKKSKPIQSANLFGAGMRAECAYGDVEADLNVFVLTFDGMKEAEKNLAGGDPYDCKKCGAILNKFSVLKLGSELMENKYEVKPYETLWECEFCGYPNKIQIQKEEVPVKDDVVYMLESALEQGESETDSTVIFCIDISGSMNATSEIAGKVELKFGLSLEEIEMLKQFMEPGDEAQFNYLPGAQNHNKTFISRKQCVLSAIESQIHELRKADPNKRVGFVLFNNEVTIIGDGKAESVSLVGDRLNNVESIVNALAAFKLTSPLCECYEQLIGKIEKAEAKGQTALGPALVAAIEVASKGSKGSTVVLCTDGLANIGVGALEHADEAKEKFYEQVAADAKAKNVAVSIITIKGEGSKVQILGKVVEATNGNIKVVNPEKLSEDFANILKDEVIGLNVSAKIMLHKAMLFRNEEEAFLKDNKTILVKEFANATVKTKISFEYEVRDEEDLKFMEINIENLKTVPFQAQITYSSPKGGRFLRVISSESKTTTEKKVMEKEANIGVVHQRIASNTAAMYSRGQVAESSSYNNMWSGYLNNNFQAPQFQAQQERFNSHNTRLNEALSNKIHKQERKMREEQAVQMKEQSMGSIIEEQAEEKEKSGFFANLFGSKKKAPAPQKAAMRSSKLQKMEVEKEKKREKSVDSDEDDMVFRNHMMEKNDDFEF